MDVKHVEPFLESFRHVMGQFGFASIRTGNLSKKGKELTGSGILLIVGIVGELKGNLVYIISPESAKKIASAMMNGTPVPQLDSMAKSAISELTNMLAAHAATGFSKIGVHIDISTPTFLQGESISITMASEKVLCLQLIADDATVDINISFDK